MREEQLGDRALRSWQSIAALCVLAVGVAALPAVPAVAHVLHVTVFDTAVAMGLLTALMIVTTTSFWHAPRWFETLELLEVAGIQLALAWLVIVSQRGDSLFWIFILAHTVLNCLDERTRLVWRLFGLAPSLIIAFFAIKGLWGAALISLPIAAIDLFFIWVGQTVVAELRARQQSQMHLRDELAALQVTHERQRISRDIHDGIGADLAAMEWRLRNLAEESSDAALQADIAELRTRLEHGISDLQAVVWALRSQSKNWGETVRYLEQRVTELAGDMLHVTMATTGDNDTELGEIALEYTRCILEAVRNAVRHAHAQTLQVRLSLTATTLAGEICDDGCGIPPQALATTTGGLANLSLRANQYGGALAITPQPSGGTSVSLRFVRPHANRAQPSQEVANAS